jgi:hypothetical protein
MNLNKNYCLFHVEGEEINFFGKLEKANIPNDIELSKIIINKELSALDIYIPWENIIQFLNIIYIEVKVKKCPLFVYIFNQGKYVLLSLPQTIASNLWHRKNNNHQIDKEAQVLKVIANEKEQEEHRFFIPYCESWMIYYNPNEPLARVFELGTHQKGVSFLIDTSNPMTNLEVSVANTIKEFFESQKGKEYQRLVKERENIS